MSLQTIETIAWFWGIAIILQMLIRARLLFKLGEYDWYEVISLRSFVPFIMEVMWPATVTIDENLTDSNVALKIRHNALTKLHWVFLFLLVAFLFLLVFFENPPQGER